MAVTLGSQIVGSSVKVNIGGIARDFIIIHQGNPNPSVYDDSCDGTWVLMKDIYTNMAWDSTDNDYANSNVHNYLNNTFINLLDIDIKNVIKQVKLPYTVGVGNSGSIATGSSGISAQVFLLSYNEVGHSGSGYANAEGTVLSYFNGAENSQKVAKLDGVSYSQWLRSPHNYSSYTGVWTINTAGGATYASHSNEKHGVRPAFIFPSNLSVNGDGFVTIKETFNGINGYVTKDGKLSEFTGEGLVKVKGVWRPIVETLMCVKGVWQSSKAPSRLPDGYTEVEYIESTGTQYINTGVSPSKNLKTEIVITPNSSAISEHGILGSTWAINGYFLMFYQSMLRWHSCGASVDVSGFNTTGKNTIVCESTKITVNGTAHTISGTGTDSTNTVMLFGGITGYSGSAHGKFKLHSCKMYNGSVLARDFVPCKNASGAVGLFDLVNNVFYPNVGSGTFTAGPAVA